MFKPLEILKKRRNENKYFLGMDEFDDYMELSFPDKRIKIHSPINHRVISSSKTLLKYSADIYLGFEEFYYKTNVIIHDIYQKYEIEVEDLKTCCKIKKCNDRKCKLYNKHFSEKELYNLYKCI